MTHKKTDGFHRVMRVEVGGAVAFVAIHSLIRGRSFGGIRVKAYLSEAEARDDALALARAMSRKVIMAGIEGGGAKTVVMAPRGNREKVMNELGAFIESLGGQYYCGPDLGFTAADGAALSRTTRYVACENFAPHTVRTVLACMKTTGPFRSVAVQGMGAVGLFLAQTLRNTEVNVHACDLRNIDGFDRIAPEDIFDVECDIFAPCATGGVLNEATIPRLRCRVVCGGANNPLATDEDADRLHERGILYIPDFLSNAGATIQGASTIVGEGHKVSERMKALPVTLQAVLERAKTENRSPHRVAVAMADERIAKLTP